MSTKTDSTTWFEVDKDGLRDQARERGPAHAFVELISNSLDERESGVTEITVTARPVPGKPLAEVSVEDNSPRGYGSFLHHAFTLFAASYKRGNAEQSGRFNFGCKQWLSLCRHARISTVTGTVDFVEEGERIVRPRLRRPVGTLVEGVMDMTREEFLELETLVGRLIVPADVTVTFNGRALPSRTPLDSFKAKLTTMVAGDDGAMQKVQRETVVDLYEPLEEETPSIYELAVPVVETDIRWVVQVGQKVPLNRDRDNVSPTFLRELKRVVADRMAGQIGQDDATGWCNDVLADAKASPQACNAIVRGRFGDKAAIFDPTDQEANVNWQTEHEGTLVHGRNLTRDQWANVKRHGLLDAAGVLAPSAKPYTFIPDGDPLEFYDEADLTPGMIEVREHAREVASAIGVRYLDVKFALSMNTAVVACYTRLGPSSGELHFNMLVLENAWFAKGVTVPVDELVIHELAHHFVGSHTHSKPSKLIPGGHFYDACCHVAAKAMDMLRQRARTPATIGASESHSCPVA